MNISKGQSCMWSSVDGIRCRLAEKNLDDSDCEICLAFTPINRIGG